jgi:purine catabolism regulator
MAATLTLAALIADPILDTSVIAGASGLDQPVRWAQTSEMADPWAWLGPGELLMTVGLSLPEDAAGQRRFVQRASAAGIVGMTVGEDGITPPLTQAMRDEADACGFPILSTGPTTPFAVIARTVAAANASEQSKSVLVLSRLYQAAAQQDPDAKRSGRWVTDLCDANVAVVDSETGATVIGDGTLVQDGLRSHTLGTVRPTRLVVGAGSTLDALTLIHLKQILTVDANALLQQALAQVAAGEAQLRLALSGGIGKHDIDGGAWLASDGVFRVVAAPEAGYERLTLAVALAGARPLLTRWKGATIAIASGADLDRLRTTLQELGHPGGSSTEQTTFADLPGAIDEALTALSDAVSAQEPWSTFRGARVALLTRSRSESMRVVADVLGPLAEDDQESLRSSLFALLEHDLNWQATADDLGIHRQTLAYRLRRVEALTGRSVRRVSDLSELWLARAAWNALSA